MDGLICTEEELRALCAEWQETLSLRDWDVKVIIARGRDFAAPRVEGEVNWVLETKTALIRALDPIDYEPSNLWPLDHEHVLVHELLHLHFAPFAPFSDDRTEDEKIAQEQAIELIARALIRLKRRAQQNVA